VNAPSDSLAVVNARLPYTDRGSFSQAWFSALHLAVEGSGRAPQMRAHRPLDDRARIACDAPPSSNAAPRASERNGVRLLSERRTASAPPSANETGRFARTMHAATTRAAREPHGAPFRTTLHVTGAGGRVEVLVRREGDTLHVIALCSARNSELVRRALARTEGALRARGQRLATSVRPLDTECGS
jgi:hypothetical protein